MNRRLRDTALKYLRAAREFLTPRGRWTQGEYDEVDDHGNVIACCAVGAIEHVAPRARGYTAVAFDCAIKRLERG